MYYTIADFLLCIYVRTEKNLPNSKTWQIKLWVPYFYQFQTLISRLKPAQIKKLMTFSEISGQGPGTNIPLIFGFEAVYTEKFVHEVNKQTNFKVLY